MGFLRETAGQDGEKDNDLAASGSAGLVSVGAEFMRLGSSNSRAFVVRGKCGGA